jgi:protein required for attachment to host cells
MRTLILIANSECASLIHLEDHRFEVVEEREHPQSKEKVGHLVSDRPGRAFSRTTAVRHALNEGQDVLAVERRKFAAEVVQMCSKRYQLCPFHALWIVTGPKFLGELRPFFDSISARPYSIREIPKEISPQEPLEIKMGKIQAWIHGDTPRKGVKNLHQLHLK